MSKVSGSWARPIQGVSQQPPKVMKDGQCQALDNMIPSAVRGLEKRIGTEHIERVLDSMHPDSKVHHYRRGTGEEYFIVLQPAGDIRIFGIDGREHVLEVTNGLAYCTTADPKQNIAMQTIADYTFVVNRTVPVLQSTALTPAKVNEAMVYCQFATYGRTYRVLVDGIVAGEFRTPDGSVSTHIDQVDVGYVMDRIAFGTIQDSRVLAQVPVFTSGGEGGELPTYTIELPAGASVTFVYETVSGLVYTVGSGGVTYVANVLYLPSTAEGKEVTVIYSVPIAGGLTLLAGYDVTQYESSFHIKRTDGAAFDIKTEDGAQGKDLIAINGFVTELSQLPPTAPDGFRVQVLGQGKKQKDSYYLEASESGGNVIKWVETTTPVTKYNYNVATMPCALVRDSIDVEGIATFVLDYAPWVARDVGGDDNNPFPGFISPDNPIPIKSVGIFQNRLYFTAGESVSMSRTGRFFDFFRNSTQVRADDDPINVYADSDQINDLMHSVVLDKDLVFFSPNAQFVLPGGKPITPDTATLSQVNTFKMQVSAAPVPAGEEVYFAYSNGRFSGIREFFTDSVIDTKRARPITEHVDRYIAGTVRYMAASTNQNWMVLLADPGNVLYVYNWIWQGQEKVQSAWHRWVLPEDERIEYATFSQDTIYLFISREEGVYLEKIDIGDPAPEFLPFPPRLDRRHESIATRDVGNPKKWTMPDMFPEEDLQDLEFVLGTFAHPEFIGCPVSFERVGGVLETYEDLSPVDICAIVCGRKFQSKFVPSQPTVKDYQQRVIEVDKLKLGQVYLNYEITGNLTVTVRDIYGNVDVSNFSGRVMGDPTNLAGFAPLVDGSFNFPVMQEAEKVTIEITSDNYLPLRIRDMEFTGQFQQRGKRI